MRNILFDITLGGEDLEAIVRAADRAGWVYTLSPPSLSMDFDHSEVQGVTFDDALARATHRIQYDDYPDLVYLQLRDALHKRLVHLRRENLAIDETALVDGLAGIPFLIASIGRLHEEWGNIAIDDDAYAAPGWGDLHVPMGWAAAFKGAGHDRLVSRRWLETGPWRFIQGPNDTSVVIFHDLDADADTALAQAKPGHDQIGISDDTGFLQIPFNYRCDLDGLYDAETRSLTSVVHGREPRPRELLEWAAIRANQRLGPEKPIDRVRFVFPEESRARAMLPLLWRYGHECWAIVDGDEVRLDTDEMPAGLRRSR